MGPTPGIVRSLLAQSVREVDCLADAVGKGRFDLAEQETYEFVERLLAGQVRALYYLAGQIDDLQAAIGHMQK